MESSHFPISRKHIIIYIHKGPSSSFCKRKIIANIEQQKFGVVAIRVLLKNLELRY